MQRLILIMHTGRESRRLIAVIRLHFKRRLHCTRYILYARVYAGDLPISAAKLISPDKLP